MLRKINYGKILVVVFLTVLIWVWADLAKTEEFPVSHATLNVAKSTNPNRLVGFGDESYVSVSIEEIVLKGPASKIAKLKRRQKEGELLKFDFDAALENMGEPGSYSLALLSFLQKDKEIKQLGLRVKSCKPETVTIKVHRLVMRSLEVVCFDEEQNPVAAAIEPPKVDMFVPEDWEGVAEVRLNRGEREQAMVLEMERTPSVRLPAGQILKAGTTVKIRVLQEQVLLAEETIRISRPGYILSANLLGQYGIVVDNLPIVMGPIRIRATADAKRAYEKMAFQVLLEILDSDKDVKSEEPLTRKLIYNFPDEYLRKGEIKLNQEPVEARFRLEPLSSAAESASSAP